MTVEVSTPKGLRTGASVIEVRTWQNKGPGGLGSVEWKVRGEAVSVYLPNGQILWALLYGPPGTEHGTTSYAPDAYSFAIPTITATIPWYVRQSALAKQRAKTELPISSFPMLIKFRNIKIPESVELVDPNGLSETFGNGYSLKRITIQITDDPVTKGSTEILRWLDEFPGPALKVEHIDSERSSHKWLTRNAFREGKDF